MFDDNIVLRANLGQKILAGHLVACRFGPNQVESLAVISQTLDKLIVHEISSVRLLQDGHQDDDRHESSKHFGEQKEEEEEDLLLFTSIVAAPPTSQEPVYLITLKDVIRSISVKSINVYNGGNDPMGDATNYWRDFLLIGCSSSILIYDTMYQINLLNLNTTTSIDSITLPDHSFEARGQTIEISPTICAGSQKIYALRFDVVNAMSSSPLDAEISSERSTSDSVNCLIQGNFNESLTLVISGSIEQKIRIYSLDSFDYNIQSCRLTLDESARVNCLQCIYTQQQDATDQTKRTRPSADQHRPQPTHADGQMLPSVDAKIEADATEKEEEDQEETMMDLKNQMNYFAYGLENGFVGVYRLFMSRAMESNHEQDEFLKAASPNEHQKLGCERLWRHKSKQVPLTMLMFDVNGDGLDELIIGYKSSRLEARNPFTGQLIATTRCFNRDRLVGLALLDLHGHGQTNGLSSTPAPAAVHSGEPDLDQKQQPEQQSPILVACSSSGSCVGFRPRQASVRRPLRGFNIHQSQQIQDNDEILHRRMSSYANFEESMEFAAAATTTSSLLLRPQQSSQDSVTPDTDSQQQQTSDLHIESSSDNTRPVKCDSRQNVELLQRLSGLLSESFELDKKARQVYHAQMHQVSSGLEHYQHHHHHQQQQQQYQHQHLTTTSPAGPVCNIRHFWSFDSRQLKLRLTIIVGCWPSERVDLIELHDESKNFLSTGHLLISVPPPSQANNYGPTTTRLEYDHSAAASSGRVRSPSSTVGSIGDSLRASSGLMQSAGPTDDLIVVVLLSSTRHEDTKLGLKVYCSSGAAAEQQHPQVARIYNRTIRVAKFAMFAPISELGQRKRAKLMDSSAIMDSRCSKMSFRLEDSLSYLQVLDWMNEHFVCSQYGSSPMRRDDVDQQRRHLLLADNDTTSQSDKLNHIDLSVDQHSSPADSGWQRHLRENEFDLRLLDVLQTNLNKEKKRNSGSHRDSLANRLHDNNHHVDQHAKCKLTTTTTSTAKTNSLNSSGSLGGAVDQVEEQDDDDDDQDDGDYSMLRIAYLKGQLEIESENSDLLVELVQFLVIDRLHLRLSADRIRAGAWQAKIEPILNELNAISSIRQLKESETRIQSELYESADYTKNLMQQFAIANQLNEFSTSKLLLNELSITLSGVENAAQAHYLNNKTRCDLSKQIGLLNEKISFLTGHNASQTV